VSYRVVYDVLQEGSKVYVPALIAGALVSFGLMVRRWPARWNAVIVGWGAIVLGALGLLAGLNIGMGESRCRSWLRNGDVSVVSGTVADFHPMPPGGHDEERFSVDGVSFSYSHNLSLCGFQQTSADSGPIRAGEAVRISHHDGRILRLEVAE
jgi:hypothetical protein